jgi:hypothetical protein
MPRIFSFKITKWACIRVELGRVDEQVLQLPITG